jgi:ABC-type transport system substrate-binding protein
VNDPRVVLGSFETPRSVGVDRTGYNDPEVNDLFKRARSATSRDEEKKLYDQILEKVALNGPYIYMWAPKTLWVGTKKLVIPKMSNGDYEFYQKMPLFWFQA